MTRDLRVALGWMALGIAVRVILGSVACDRLQCPTEGPLAFGVPVLATYHIESDYPALDGLELVVRAASRPNQGELLDIQTPRGVVTYAVPIWSDTGDTGSPQTP